MKKILSFAAILLMLAGMTSACGKEDEKEVVSLKDPKWKLAGFVNAQTGNITEPTPQCRQCYYLAFDTDTTAYGYSLGNIISLSLKPVVCMGTMTEVGDAHNGTVDMFYEAMESLCSYTIENNTLKIFYNNSKNYLLFKPYES